MYTDLIDKGYACLRRSDPDSALIRFQHAAELESEKPQAYFGQAMAYIELESSEEVQRSLEAALQADATYVPARAYLAIEYLKRYDLDKAQDELELSLRYEPTSLLVHIKYAEYYYRLGFYHRAVEYLERGLKGPHGANEHVVHMAREFLKEARQKRKNIILREPPDPRRLLRFFAWSRSQKAKETPVRGEVELN